MDIEKLIDRLVQYRERVGEVPAGFREHVRVTLSRLAPAVRADVDSLAAGLTDDNADRVCEQIRDVLAAEDRRVAFIDAVVE